MREPDVEFLKEEAKSLLSVENVLAQMKNYVVKGSIDKAFEMAKLAMSKFPNSGEVIAMCRDIKRMWFDNRIAKLRREIELTGDIASFEQLVMLYYKEIGDKNKALDVSKEALQKYPDSDSLHFMCGRIQMDRFHEEEVPADCEQAIEHFQMAIKLNPQNYKALLFLGALYSEMNLYKDAEDVFRMALEINPSDETASNAIKLLSNKPKGESNIGVALKEIERRGVVDEGGKEITRLVIRVPKKEIMKENTLIDIQRAKQVFESLKDTEGVKFLSIITNQREVVLDYPQKQDMIGGVKFSDMLYDVSKTIGELSKKIGIGNFLNGKIEVGGGIVYIWSSGTIILGVFFASSKNFREKEILKKLSQF